MATANDVLRIAAGELGYSRWTDPQPGTKYGRWYAQAHGSDLIRAVQRRLGCGADGLLGPATIRAIQAHYGLARDASFGPATARALQSALNQGRF